MYFPELRHPDENHRLADLESIQILETPLEERFERMTRLVQRAFDIPICAISCIDEHRQWFKSIQGLNVTETARCVSFCQHTILQHDVMVVENARQDARFKDNPLVTDEPKIVFYAGTPIYSKNRIPIASLCIIDVVSRTMDIDEIEMLYDFARMVESELHAASHNAVHDQLVRSMNKTWRASLIDPLTRLWNHEGAAAFIAGCNEPDHTHQKNDCVVFMNLQSYDEINSKLGFVFGDDTLRTFTKYLLKQLHRNDMVGRLAGNTFCILIRETESVEEIQSRLNSLQTFLDSYPINGIKGREFLGGHIASIVLPSNQQINAECVFERLNELLFQAKTANAQRMAHAPILRFYEDLDRNAA